MGVHNIDNIIFRKEKTNPTIDSDDALYELPRYKDVEYLAPLENFIPFIKACESLIRKSPYYKRYVAYIKSSDGLGLNSCQILGNIQEIDEDEKLIDMHHGPILTLFDYCVIITNYLLNKNIKVDTFIVAKIVIREHFENNIGVIMVSETVHDTIHDISSNIYINLNQGFGDTYRFLKKYKAGLDVDIITKINRYYILSQKFNTNDNDLFKITEFINKENKHFGYL